MRCVAIAKGTGERCKLPAVVDGMFCETPAHRSAGWPVCEEGRELLQERAAAEGSTWSKPQIEPDPAPSGVSVDPGAHPEPSRRDFFSGPDPQEGGKGPSAVDLSRGLVPPFPGPAAEPGADPPELDAALFAAAIREMPPPEASSELEASGPAAAAAVRRVWTPDQARRFVCPPLNRRFTKDGKDELSAGEEDLVGEAVAGVANELLARVDPNNPYAALFLAAAVITVPRYAPDLGRSLYYRVRGQGPAPKSSQGARARPGPTSASQGPDPETGEEPVVDAVGWTAAAGLEA